MGVKYTFNPLSGKLDALQDVSGFVPYTGATDDVDLGNHTLTVGGIASGMSSFGQGMTINNLQGGTANDDFIAKTLNSGNALLVDASEDLVKVNVDFELSSGATVDTIETTLTDDDTHIPTSGAIIDKIALYVPYAGATDDVDLGAHSLEMDVNEVLQIGDYTLTNNGTEFVMDDGLVVGGDGLSIMAKGITINDDAGSGADSDVTIKTQGASAAFFIDASADTAEFNINLYLKTIKSGATQVGAGASAGEIWKTSSHATLPDNVLMIGV